MRPKSLWLSLPFLQLGDTTAALLHNFFKLYVFCNERIKGIKSLFVSFLESLQNMANLEEIID